MNKSRKSSEPPTLRDLLDSSDEAVKRLFVKVMNLHAGYQIEERTKKQLVDAVRSETQRMVEVRDRLDRDDGDI